MNSNNLKIVGLVGSIASIIALIIFFFPTKPTNSISIEEQGDGNQVVIGEEVTINNSPKNDIDKIKSASDLLEYSGRVTSLPNDILTVIRPGVSIEFVKEILKAPTHVSQTDTTLLLKYKFENCALRIFSSEKTKVSAVTIEVDPEMKNTGFTLPEFMDSKPGFVLGTTNWDDVISYSRSKKAYFTHAGRWFKLYAEIYEGVSSDYQTIIVGSECEIPKISNANQGQEGWSPDNEKVDLIGNLDIKISYMVLSNLIFSTNEYDGIIPICY